MSKRLTSYLETIQKTVTEDKEYYVIKGLIQKEKTVANKHLPNTGAPHILRQMLIAIKVQETQVNSNRRIVGDFNAPLTSMNGSEKKVSKET